MVPIPRPLSVPVPLFVMVTGCDAGLAEPAVARNVTACDDSDIAGAGTGCVVWPPVQATAPTLPSNTRIRRMQPLTKELPRTIPIGTRTAS